MLVVTTAVYQCVAFIYLFDSLDTLRARTSIRFTPSMHTVAQLQLRRSKCQQYSREVSGSVCSSHSSHGSRIHCRRPAAWPAAVRACGACVYRLGGSRRTPPTLRDAVLTDAC